MTKKIMWSILAVASLVLLVSLSVVTAVLYNRFEKNAADQLHAQLALAEQGVEYGGLTYLESLDTDDCRITWVSKDGTVLYDSRAEADTMDNHLDREEIAEAKDGGRGESLRYSDTLMQQMLYSACLMADGTVLRVAAPMESGMSLLREILVPMLLVFIGAVLVSVLVARRMAKGIVEPLNALDLEHPTHNETYEEIDPILQKLGKQRQEIAAQMKQLHRKQDEFEQIVSSMNEGLVLLSEQGTVISMNTAAKTIFSVSGYQEGCCFSAIDHSADINQAIREAFDGQNQIFCTQKNGKEYRFDISRIESGGKTRGAVILAFDITETAFAERNRREFTANVSHELKTPLQSIIGSAELLENGLVKPEDTPRFVGNIKNEATRLVSLINDIIHLSQLDENQKPTTEAVELMEVAKEVADVLSASAAKKRVSLRVEGKPCIIQGVRRYLYEVIYNLCDNAIRYNVDGGSVTVLVREKDGKTVLAVSDTGIGIAPEHHARVFERFYRVDKSHSKETGGTGLGLSIVKHAVQYHGGSMTLDSAVGKGTTVTITF